MSDPASDDAERRYSLRREAVEAAYQSLKIYHVDRRKIVFFKSQQKRSGGYGTVRRASLYLSMYLPACLAWRLHGPPQVVAVKQIRMSAADDPDDLKRAFTKELLVWSGLKAHPGIAKFMGFYADFERSEAWLLSPWEPHGNITDFINRRQLEVPEKLSLVYDTIDALTFLHQLEPPVCHGDIKSANVLVNCECRAVLCDFGLARLYEDSGFQRLETSTGFKGSIRWCSPELLDGGPRTSSSDIYAWAWLVWEIMTGELPYQDAVAEYAIIRRIFESPHPQVDGESRLSDCLQLWELMTRCWVLAPEQRPTGSMCRTAVDLLPHCTPQSGEVDPLIPSPELLENLGTLESWKGNFEDSIAHLDKALRLYEERDDSRGIARVHTKQADVFYRHSRWVPSIDHATAALAKFRSLEDDLGAADALHTLGCAIYLQSTADEAIGPLQEALEIFRIHSHDIGIVNCLERLGEICRWNLRLTEATTYLEDAIAIASQSGDKAGETRATKSLAYVFWQSGDNARATATFTVTAEAARRLGLGSVLCDSLYCLATINYEEGKYEDAAGLYQESISVARSRDDGFTLSKSLEGLVKVHGVQGDVTARATSLEELWTCYQSMSYRGPESIWAASQLAEVKKSQGDKQATLYWFDKAIAEARELLDKRELALWLAEKGRVLRDDQQYEEAALYFEASLILDRELGRAGEWSIRGIARLPKTAIRDVGSAVDD